MKARVIDRLKKVIKSTDKSIKTKRSFHDMARHTVNLDDLSESRLLRIVNTIEHETTEQLFTKLTEDELFSMDPFELTDRMIKSDPLLDKALDDFVTYCTSEFEYSCEDPRGDEVIDNFLMTLDDKRNSFTQTLVKTFTSIFLRGSVCVEVVFDNMLQPSNLFCIDPRFLDFRSDYNEIDGDIWTMGQYQQGAFVPIDSPTVIYEAMNPLLELPHGRSMISSGFPSLISSALMHQDLRKIVRNHAWPQRFIAINIIALRQAGFEFDDIEQIVETDKELIKNEWQQLPPEITPIGTGEIEMRQYPGSTTNLSFVDILDRMYDRKSIRAVKNPPFMSGSNEFVAESSAEEQAIQYSIRISSFQSTVQHIFERVFVQVIRSQGIAGKVKFLLKRVNAKERKREAEIFDIVIGGLQKAIASGISLPLAINIYQDLTGLQVSEELIQEIKEYYETMPKPDMPDEDEPMEEPDMPEPDEPMNDPMEQRK